MSKSYKKSPIIKDNNRCMKKIANRKIRYNKEIPNGMVFKKFFSSDIIHNRNSYYSEEQYKKFYLNFLKSKYNDVEIVYQKNNKWCFKINKKLNYNYSYLNWSKDYKVK